MKEINTFSFYKAEGKIFDTKEKNVIEPIKKLEWNVIVENNDSFYVGNVFNLSVRFNELLIKTYKKYKNDLVSFAKELYGIALYSYWAKCEYEIIITTWPTYINYEELQRLNKELNDKKEKFSSNKIYRLCVDLEHEIKIDVFSQLMLNWDQFVSYTWNNRKLINKLK